MTDTRTIDERLANDTAAVKRYTDRVRELRRLALMNAIDPEALKIRLRHYESTSDHDHGSGPLKPGAECPGGDCLVARARRVLAAMEAAHEVAR